MAGMFYSLKETAERLGRTEDEVRQLAEEGKLREFRDGSNLLFKIDEVDALLAEGTDVFELEQLTEQEQPAEVAEEPAEAEPAAADLGTDAFELDQLVEQEQPAEIAEEELAAVGEDEAARILDEPLEEEPAAAVDESFDEDMFKMDEEQAPALEATDEADATSQLGLAPVAEEPTPETPEAEDLFLLEEDQQPAAPTPEGSSEEIALAPESGILASESDITDMDTALTGEGVSVLGESDVDYEVTDDSMAETAAAAGTGSEASLEEIEEDVSLDSFGSGSGLLDLSLQADDTSLGGILDEIYTAEGAEEGQPPAEEASFEELTAEVERPPVEEELAVPEPVAVMPTPVTATYVEAVPDTQSNVLGGLLFLPLLALLYTAIVTVAAMRNVMPSILASIQGLVWYITGGAIVVSLIAAGTSFVVGGEKAPRAAKPRKEKRPRAEKPAKEKKAKPEKPAREKKSFFGKKK